MDHPLPTQMRSSMTPVGLPVTPRGRKLLGCSDLPFHLYIITKPRVTTFLTCMLQRHNSMSNQNGRGSIIRGPLVLKELLCHPMKGSGRPRALPRPTGSKCHKRHALCARHPTSTWSVRFIAWRWLVGRGKSIYCMASVVVRISPLNNSA